MILEEVKSRQEELVALCQEYEVEQLELFGSAITGEFRETDSDLDFLVVLRQPTRRDVVQQYFELKAQLEKLFDRSIDLVERSQVKNPFVIDSIRKQSRLRIYAS